MIKKMYKFHKFAYAMFIADIAITGLVVTGIVFGIKFLIS